MTPQYSKRARTIWLKISGNALVKNLDASKRPYPCNALGRSACLGQGCVTVTVTVSGLAQVTAGCDSSVTGGADKTDVWRGHTRSRAGPRPRPWSRLYHRYM